MVRTRNVPPEGWRDWSILRPVLVVAPHLCLPARNGADILVERLSRNLSWHSDDVELIGSDFHCFYNRGKITRQTRFENSLFGKPLGAVLTLVRGSHYLLERFNTPRYMSYLGSHVDWTRFGTILASFLTTRQMLPRVSAQQRLLVLTHNDEMKWFGDRVKAERNFVARKVAMNSLKWLNRNTVRLTEGATLIHVSEADRAGYARLAPNHNSFLFPIGTDLDESPQWPTFGFDDRVILSFIGALSVQMASDALHHFRAVLLPGLQAAFREKLVVRVVGSGPSSEVKKLARQTGWELHADVSDEQLARLLRESTFTILPFPYATGVKLKLMRSLGSGVPYLATLAAGRPDMIVPAGCCCSDSGADWVGAINDWRNSAEKAHLRAGLLKLAREHSWAASTARLVTALQMSGPVSIS
jgi:hypothetical protein